MTMLVTGGTGLVGSRLLRHFVNAGISCRGLIRLGKKVPIEVAAVNGDLCDLSSLQEAVVGVTAIVHLAALFRTKDDNAIWRTNCHDTLFMLDWIEDPAL